MSIKSMQKHHQFVLISVAKFLAVVTFLKVKSDTTATLFCPLELYALDAFCVVVVSVRINESKFVFGLYVF